MRTRSSKYKKANKKPSGLKLITSGLLIIMILFSILMMINDNSVSVDLDAQKTLYNAYHYKNQMEFNIPEKRYQEILHKMTHQKVKSNDKLGSVELSSNNVEGMLNILNESDYKHSELYRDILNKWKSKNFNSIVSDHNKIWKLLGKPDGRVIFKMSKVKEDKFIKEKFTRTE